MTCQFNPKKIVTISLPSFEWSEVKMYSTISIWETREIMSKYPNMSDVNSDDSIEASIELIEKQIISWNFVDSEWIEIPVNKEIIKQMPSEDYSTLTATATWNVEKKNIV